MGCTKEFTLTKSSGAASLDFYWTMDEASGDRVDSVASLHLAQWHAVPLSAVAGIQGLAVEIPCQMGGFLGLFVEADTNITFDAVTAKGISWWFWHKVTAAPTDGAITFFEFELYDSMSSNDCRIRTELTYGPGTISFEHENFRTSVTVDSNPVSFSTTVGQWHFFCGTLDLVANTLKTYVDGVLVDTVADVAGFDDADNGDFNILTDLGGTPDALKIAVDEVGLSFSGAISAAQVLALYNAGAGVTYPGVTSIVPI
jgi:hypothetical protein